MTISAILLTPVEGRTRMISSPNEKQALTDARVTDARTALTRGLREYLEQITGVADGGRELKFAKVLQAYAEPEVPAAYPAAIVYAGQPGQYDANSFTPSTYDIGSGLSLRSICEFVQPIDLEVWSTDPVERMALVGMLEDALNPVDWMTGLRLELPHYHNARATYEITSMAYLDAADDAQRRWRKAAFSITASLTQYKRLGFVKRLAVKIATTVGDNVNVTEQEAGEPDPGLVVV